METQMLETALVAGTLSQIIAPVLTDEEWQEISTSTSMVDRAIAHMSHEHGFSFDELTLFVGNAWSKRFAHDGKYRSIDVVTLNHQVVCLAPKLDCQGHPYHLMVDGVDEKYLTVRRH